MLDFIGKVEHGAGIAIKEGALLRLEEREETAVVGELGAETLRDKFPLDRRSHGSTPVDLEAGAEAAAVVPRGVSCFSSIRPRPRPGPEVSCWANVSVIMSP